MGKNDIAAETANNSIGFFRGGGGTAGGVSNNGFQGDSNPTVNVIVNLLVPTDQTFNTFITTINNLYNSRFIRDFTFKRESCVLREKSLPTLKTATILGVVNVADWGAIVDPDNSYGGKTVNFIGRAHYYAFHTVLLFLKRKSRSNNISSR